MDLAKKVLQRADDFPINSVEPPKVGKVRCVYDLGDERLALIITDKISAFDVGWHTEDDVWGIYRKGLCLNKQTKHWFDLFKKEGLGDNHIMEEIHPYVWICHKAEPVMVEAIYRHYITGSMWRKYAEGKRELCGNALPEGLQKNDRLEESLFTPTTKGVLKIDGIPEEDDTPITFEQIVDKYKEFGFKSEEDVARFRDMGFAANVIMYAEALKTGNIFVDDKKEGGYIGGKLMWIDEQGTLDSSRFWDKETYEARKEAVEKSKEYFRGPLIAMPFGAELTKKGRDMDLVRKIAQDHTVPREMWDKTSSIYQNFTTELTGKELTYDPVDIREDIMAALADAKLLK